MHIIFKYIIIYTIAGSPLLLRAIEYPDESKASITRLSFCLLPSFISVIAGVKKNKALGAELFGNLALISISAMGVNININSSFKVKSFLTFTTHILSNAAPFLIYSIYAGNKLSILAVGGITTVASVIASECLARTGNFRA